MGDRQRPRRQSIAGSRKDSNASSDSSGRRLSMTYTSKRKRSSRSVHIEAVHLATLTEMATNAKSPSSSSVKKQKDGSYKAFPSSLDDEAKGLEKQGSMAWRILSNSQVLSLCELSPEDLEKKLCEILQLGETMLDLNLAAILDYYVAGFWWAKEQSFTPQQISGFFTLLHSLLTNIQERKLDLSENIKELKLRLAGIGNENSEIFGGMEFFDVKQAKLISDYFHITLFQHHRMYYFLFHGEREEMIIGNDLSIEVEPPAEVPYPPPLDEGLDQDTYSSQLLEPQPLALAQQMEEVQISHQPDGGDPESEGERIRKESIDVLKDVSMDDVQKIMNSVSKELLGGLQAEVNKKLKDREMEYLMRINKIHKVVE